MKKLIIGLIVSFLLGGIPDTSAGITERVIYAGDTPLYSDCTVVQSGPLELTVPPCMFTTTGQAKIFNRLQSLPAMVGAGPLAAAVRDGKAEWMRDGLRIRAWIRDKQGKIIERAVTYQLPVASVITVPPGDTYFIYLVENPGKKMDTVLLPTNAPSPSNYVHYLAFEFTVPLGTINLSGIKIEVFTVRPSFPPARSMFEK